MRNEFTAIIERDGEWYIAYCPEVPRASGQGHTVEECRALPRSAIGWRERFAVAYPTLNSEAEHPIAAVGRNQTG